MSDDELRLTEPEEVIVLTGEDGTDHEYTVACVAQIADKTYALLLPADDNSDEEAAIMRVEPGEDGEEDALAEIVDEAEFNLVSAAFEAILDQMDGEDEASGVQ